jgi:hypothetical protein
VEKLSLWFVMIRNAYHQLHKNLILHFSHKA